MERVREEGLEPSQSFDLNDLNVARLPFFSPFPHDKSSEDDRLEPIEK